MKELVYHLLHSMYCFWSSVNMTVLYDLMC